MINTHFYIVGVCTIKLIAFLLSKGQLLTISDVISFIQSLTSPLRWNQTILAVGDVTILPLPS